MVKAVSIVGRGPNLAGDLYLPDLSRGPVPAVVTGSGFGGVKEMLLPVFCEALAAAGIAVLSIDFAGFGASAGEPRQHVDPVAQVAGLRRGLDYLSTMPGSDPARLGVWGPSRCGAHTLVVAGPDPRVGAAVSIIPFVKAPRVVAAKVGWAVVVDSVRRLLG